MTPITVDIYSSIPSRKGGRYTTLITSYETTAWVSWDISQYSHDDRISGAGAVAEVEIMCQPQIPELSPDTTRITIDGVAYQPVNMITDDMKIFGKTGNYNFFITEWKDT